MIDRQDDTIGETTFRTIRSEIINGVLLPGDRLPLDKLKQRYAVSVSTLREVLTRLASESFVVAEGQRGFEVAAASLKELRELGELRLLLESHALARSLHRGDLEWEGRVVAAHHKLSAIEKRLLAGENYRTPDWIQYDRHFHETLISACGSASLMGLHATVFDRFMRYHMLAGSFRGKPVADDHLALLQAALSRDETVAQTLLAAHVEKGIEHIIATGRIGR